MEQISLAMIIEKSINKSINKMLKTNKNKFTVYRSISRKVLFPLLASIISTQVYAEQTNSQVETTEQPCLEENCDVEFDLEEVYRNSITNTIWENKAPTEIFYDEPFHVSLFSAENGEDKERLWSQTKSVFAYGVAVIGVLYIMPESITNWDKDDEDFIKWGSNVKSGPR